MAEIHRADGAKLFTSPGPLREANLRGVLAALDYAEVVATLRGWTT